MSLIEQALRKRQAAHATASGPAQPAPRVIDNPQRATPPPLGDPARRKSVDFDALRKACLLPTPSEERLITHQFQSIKRPLIRAAFADTD